MLVGFKETLECCQILEKRCESSKKYNRRAPARISASKSDKQPNILSEIKNSETFEYNRDIEVVNFGYSAFKRE